MIKYPYHNLQPQYTLLNNNLISNIKSFGLSWEDTVFKLLHEHKYSYLKKRTPSFFVSFKLLGHWLSVLNIKIFMPSKRKEA